VLTELGFFGIILHHNMPKEASMISLPSTSGITVATPSLTVWVKCFADTRMLHDETDEVTIVFYRQVHNEETLSRFVEMYRTQGISSIESLNGSFAFLLIDKLRGEVVGVIGHNGAGKTTLLNLTMAH